MSAGATALVPHASLDDDAWDDLLSFIEERRVIPIIGPELLQVETDQGPRLLHDWLAEKLARRAQRRRRAAAPAVHAERRRLLVPGRAGPARGSVRAPARHPEGCRPSSRRCALRQLAAIPEFDLFVTTTFDSLLENAINLERFGGASSTEVLSLLAQSRRRPADRARSPAAAGRVSPVRPALRLAHLRDLRRGSAGVHLRAAERAPRAREAVPRARAQPPAVHRQQLHQLAGAPVPAHGQAPAAVGPARRRRGAGRRPLAARTSAWCRSCSR